VADQSAPSAQREFLSEAVAARFPGFDAVTYPHWHAFLTRLSAESDRAGWHGPVIFDEFPYLVAADSSLASVFQNWIDREAARQGLVVAVAGSSQRMMQGLVLDAAAPLYGRSRAQLELKPLLPGHIRVALGCAGATKAVQAYSVWGGIPQY